MKKHITPSRILTILFMVIVFFSSFSVDYSKVEAREDAREEQTKEQRYQSRLKKQKNRLQQRLEKTQNVAQQGRIQKKIRKIQQKQDDGYGTPILGILGMVLSIVGVIMLFAFLIILLSNAIGAAAGLGTALALSTKIAILGGAIGTSFAGMILSIIGLVLHKNNPDKFGGKGFAVAGMIIGIVACAILLFVALLFFLLL